MAENITRTAYGAFLQTVKYLGIPFQMIPNTTLNERFGINAGVAPSANAIPEMQYFCIGVGGHSFTVGADSIPVPTPIQHEATDAACFKPIPFVLRPVTSDLSQVQQTNYALRSVITINSVQYVAYYLKRIDLTQVTAQMQLVSVNAGVETVTPFTPNSSNLNPTPQTPSNSGTNVVTGNYVSASAPVGLIFSQTDATELQNVATIMFGNPDYAIISEIGLCSGVDKVVSVTPTTGATYNFNDAIAVQIQSFIETIVLFAFNNNGTNILLDLGCTEPLFTQQ